MSSFLKFAIGFSAALALAVLGALIADVAPVWIMVGALVGVGLVLSLDLAKSPRTSHVRLPRRIHER